MKKRIVSMMLVFAMLLTMLPYQVMAAKAEEPEYAVSFYSASAAKNTVTFKITTNVYPEVDTTVNYRIWSGEASGPVTAYSDSVVFEYDDYSSGREERYVTVSLDDYEEGLDSYGLDGYDSPTVQCSLVSVDGQGSISPEHETAYAELPDRRIIHEDAIYMGDGNDQFYVTNSLQLDLIPSRTESEFEEIVAEYDLKGTAVDTGKAIWSLHGDTLKGCVLFYAKTLLRTADVFTQIFTDSDSFGSFMLGLEDIDPNAGYVVNFLRNEDGGAYLAGSATDEDKYDNSYYEYIDTEYYVYFENRAWNNGADFATAENARLNVYEMNSDGFVFSPIESSNGDSWMNASVQASDVWLYKGWEDYTRMKPESAKSSFPTGSTTADSGFRNYEVNKKRVVELESPITVPFSTDLTYNNNVADYTPDRETADYVYRLKTPRLGYYIELPSMLVSTRYRLDQNYIYYMIHDDVAPEAVDISLSNTVYGRHNTIYASVEFDEAVASLSEDTVLEMRYSDFDSVELKPVRITGGNRVLFAGNREDKALMTYTTVNFTLTGTVTDAAGNSREYTQSDPFVQNEYEVRLVKDLGNATISGTPTVRGYLGKLNVNEQLIASEIPYEYGTETSEAEEANVPVFLNVSVGESDITSWQYRLDDGEWTDLPTLSNGRGNIFEPEQRYIGIECDAEYKDRHYETTDLPVRYGMYENEDNGDLIFIIDNTGVYNIVFRAVMASGNPGPESEPITVNYRDPSHSSGVFSLDTGYWRDRNYFYLDCILLRRLGGDEGRFRVTLQIGTGNSVADKSVLDLDNSYEMNKRSKSVSYIFEDGDTRAKLVETNITNHSDRNGVWLDSGDPNDGKYFDGFIVKVEHDTGEYDAAGNTVWEDISLDESYDCALTSDNAASMQLFKDIGDANKMTRDELDIVLNGIHTATDELEMHQERMGSNVKDYTYLNISQVLSKGFVFDDATLDNLLKNMGTDFYFRVSGTQTMDPAVQIRTDELSMSITAGGKEYFHGSEDVSYVDGDKFDLPGKSEFNKEAQTTSSDRLKTIDLGDGSKQWYYISDFDSPGVSVAMPKLEMNDSLGSRTYKLKNLKFTWAARDRGVPPSFKGITANSYRYTDGDYAYIRVTFSEPVYIDENAELTLLKTSTRAEYGTVPYLYGNGSYTLVFGGLISGNDDLIYFAEPGITVLWPAGNSGTVTDIIGNKNETLKNKSWSVSLDGVSYDPELPDVTVRDGGTFYISSYGETTLNSEEFYFVEVSRDGEAQGEQSVHVRTFNENAFGYYEENSTMLSFDDGDTQPQTFYVRKTNPDATLMDSYGGTEDVRRYFGVEIHNVFGGGRLYTEATENYIEDPEAFTNAVGGSKTPAASDTDYHANVVRFEVTPYQLVDHTALLGRHVNNEMKMVSGKTVTSTTPSVALRAPDNIWNYYQSVPGIQALTKLRTMTVRDTWVLSAYNAHLSVKDMNKRELFKGYEDYDNLTSETDKYSETNYFPKTSHFNNSNWKIEPVNVEAFNLEVNDPKNSKYDRGVNYVYMLDHAYMSANAWETTAFDAKIILKDPALYYLYRDIKAPEIESIRIEKDYVVNGRVARVNVSFREIVYSDDNLGIGNTDNATMGLYIQSDGDSPLLTFDYVSGFGTDTLTFQAMIPEDMATLPDNLAVKLNCDVYDSAGNLTVGGTAVDTDISLRNTPKAPVVSFSSAPAESVDGYYSAVTVTLTSQEEGITIYYSLDGNSQKKLFRGETGTGIATFNVTETGTNYHVYAMAVREADGATSPFVSCIEFKIDNIQPSIDLIMTDINGTPLGEMESVGWTNEDVYLKPNVIGGLVSHEVTVQRRDVDTLKEPEDITNRSIYPVERNGTYRFTVTNSLGRTAFVDRVIDKVDKIAPVLLNTHFSKADAPNADGSTTLYVTADVRDTQSGVEQFAYFFEYFTGAEASAIRKKTDLKLVDVTGYNISGGNRRCVFTIAMPAGVDHTLYLFPVDAVGNVDYVNNSEGIITADRLPTIESLQTELDNNDDCVSNNAFTPDLNTIPTVTPIQDTPQPPALTVTPDAFDGWVSTMDSLQVSASSAKGLTGIKWQLLDSNQQTVDSDEKELSGDISSEFRFMPESAASGSYTIRVCATDMDSATTIVNIPVQLDIDVPSAPELIVNGMDFDPDAVYSVGDLFKIRTPETSKEESAETAQYRINGGEWQNALYTGIRAPAGEYDLDIRTVDEAGNVSATVSLTVNIEASDQPMAVVTSVTAGGENYVGQWTNQDVEFTLANIGVQADGYVFAYSMNNGEWVRIDDNIFTATESGTYRFAMLAEGAAEPTQEVAGTYSVSIDKISPEMPDTIENNTRRIRRAAINWITNEKQNVIWEKVHDAAPEHLWHQLAEDETPDENGWLKTGQDKVSLHPGEYFLHLQVRDEAGNVSHTRTLKVYVDNVAPAVTLNSQVSYKESTADYTGTPTPFDVTMTLTASAYSGIESASYTIDGGISQPLSLDSDGVAVLSITEETQANYEFTIISGSGLITKVKQRVHIDRSAAERASVVIARAAGDLSTDNVYSAAPTVTITKPEEEGVEVSYFCLTDGNIGELKVLTEDSETLPAFTSDGVYELRVYTRDAAGNISKTEPDGKNYESFIIIIDTIAPAVTSVSAFELRSVSDTVQTIDAAELFTDSNDLTYSFTPYTLTETWIKGETQIGDSYMVPADFKGKVEVVATDSANHKSATYTVFFGREDSAPIVTPRVNGGLSDDGQWYYGDDLSFSLKVSGNGLDTVTVNAYRDGFLLTDLSGTFPCGGAVVKNWEQPIVHSGDFSVQVTAKDVHGNTSQPILMTFGVDLEAPVITDLSRKSDTAMNVSATDYHSGLAYVAYQLVKNGGSVNEEGWNTLSANGTIRLSSSFSGTVYVRAEDNAGNTSQTSAIVESTSSLDSILPLIPGGADKPSKPPVEDTSCDGGDSCPANGFIDVDTAQWYHEAVDYVIVNKLMNGTGFDIFEPLSTTSRGMIVTILYRLEGSPDVSDNAPFTDLSQDWYKDPVAWAAANGIVEGYGNGLYGPEDTITREQLATILWRYAKYKEYDVSVGEDTNILSYEDASQINEWAISAMQWAVGEGIMQGYAGYLNPIDSSKRCEAAAMLMRFIENATK